ncbi:hypothetical protein [Clostridium boliviensis]|uniref:hypothetical protein n=1 Tax=Clostridium boliviensis TaxID=318465 RepID=UPI00296541E0|nr:hypothetical protein [Clostridium boliviensis]
METKVADRSYIHYAKDAYDHMQGGNRPAIIRNGKLVNNKRRPSGRHPDGQCGDPKAGLAASLFK